MEPLSRRGVVASGGLAGGLALLARTSPARAAPPVAPGTPRGVSGPVALWTRFTCDGGASFQLAQLDGSAQPVLARATLGPDRVQSMAQVHAASRGFAVAAVARSWGVQPASCRIDAHAVTHPPSGRSVRYVGWVDFD